MSRKRLSLTGIRGWDREVLRNHFSKPFWRRSIVWAGFLLR
jgi:hypothetical protein